MNYYGIDLGTSSSILTKVSTSNEEPTLEIVKIDGKEKLNSIITLENLDHIAIGKDKHINLNKTLYRIKGKLANEKAVSVGKTNVSVQFCAALLLAFLKKYIDGSDDIVITIPNFYDQSKRNATLDSAKQAGFNKIKLMEEPSSAAMFHIYNTYNRNHNEYLLKEKNILVFDFGAGTLDLSLVHVGFDEKNKIEPIVNSIKGLENFGGYLIDLILAKKIIELAIYLNESKELIEVENKLSYNIKSYLDNNNEELYRYDEKTNEILHIFMKEAEKTKILLSKNESVSICIEGFIDNLEVNREEFEEIVFSENSFEKKIQKLITQFKVMNKKEIDEVILVGGTARIPFVKNIVKQNFKNSKIVDDENYINAVAYGAALISALWSGVDIAPFGTNLCRGVVPRDIYINFNNNEEKIIKAGTGYPLVKSKEILLKVPFSLSKSIDIKVIEKDDNGKDKLVSKTEFYHPCFFTGDIIKLCVNIDENGLIKFKAIHTDTKEDIEFTSYKENALSSKLIENGKNHIKNKVVFVGEK